MNTRFPFAAAVVAAAVSVVSTGCNRADKTTPVAESQTQSPVRTANQPMTVTGCLRAGEAAETFVLTTSGTDVATYNLTGDESINLRDHVGRQVSVEGVLTAQQQTATRASGPAADRATGTSGKPTVETRTTLDVRQLEVRTVKRTGEDCK